MKFITHKAAKELGLKHYFTGKPCKRGHIAKRKVSSRNCCECDLVQSRGNPNKLAYMAEYSRVNRDRENARARQWYADNKDRHRSACRAYFEQNKESIAETARAWREGNPNKVRDYSRARKARVRSAEGTWSAKDIQAMMDAQSGLCIYCKADIRIGYHVDHIMPLYLWGSNWPSNLQLLCKTCNLRKGRKHPDDFAAAMSNPPLLTQPE